jgi:hypothetical protein
VLLRPASTAYLKSASFGSTIQQSIRQRSELGHWKIEEDMRADEEKRKSLPVQHQEKGFLLRMVRFEC